MVFVGLITRSGKLMIPNIWTHLVVFGPEVELFLGLFCIWVVGNWIKNIEVFNNMIVYIIFLFWFLETRTDAQLSKTVG